MGGGYRMFVGMSKVFGLCGYPFLEIKKLQATSAPGESISHYLWKIRQNQMNDNKIDDVLFMAEF